MDEWENQEELGLKALKTTNEIKRRKPEEEKAVTENKAKRFVEGAQVEETCRSVREVLFIYSVATLASRHSLLGYTRSPGKAYLPGSAGHSHTTCSFLCLCHIF